MPDSVEGPDSETMPPTGTGRIELVFQNDPEGRSYLAEQYSSYPFHICRAHYVDKNIPGMATLYTQSCAGGIFKEDRLFMKIHGREHVWTHVTTQASTIVHRMEEGFARQQVDIIADQGALIEYLPDTTILFPKAKLQSSINIRRHPDSDVIVADSFLTHDPGNADETFSWYESELVIQQPDGRVDAIDRFSVTGETFISGETSAPGQNAVYGTFAVISGRADNCAFSVALRSCMEARADVYAGVSRLPNDTGCWVRYFAMDSVAAKAFATALWGVSRELLTGYTPDSRRK